MSELSVFELIILPVKVGNLFTNLLKELGPVSIIGKNKYQWPTTMQRQELLRSCYHEELEAKGAGTLTKPQNDGLGTLRRHQAHLEAMIGSIEKMELISKLAEEKFAPEMSLARSNIQMLKAAIQSETSDPSALKAASRADSLLRNITMEVHTTLAGIEQEATKNLMAKTLDSMGYRTKAKNNVVIGGKNDSVIRAQIAPEGHISLDTKSFSGLSCQKEVARLENRFREQGVILRRLTEGQFSPGARVHLRSPFPTLNQAQDALSSQKGLKEGTAEQEPFRQAHHNHLISSLMQRQAQKLKVK